MLSLWGKMLKISNFVSEFKGLKLAEKKEITDVKDAMNNYLGKLSKKFKFTSSFSCLIRS